MCKVKDWIERHEARNWAYTEEELKQRSAILKAKLDTGGNGNEEAHQSSTPINHYQELSQPF